MAVTNTQLQADIADLTERVRAIRVEKGLPADPLPRPRSVDIPLSLALIDRLQPFKAIVVKLATILAQGQTARIDTGKLEKYAEYGRLLAYSRGTWSFLHSWGVHGAFSIIERMNSAIDNGQEADFDTNDAMRRIHYAIGYMTKDSGLDNDKYHYYKESGAYPHEEKERLLSDPAALQAAIDEAMTLIPTEEETMNYE
ncbi:hypothetical protein [Paenibacillus odorifer]|uniref:Uncharacterized protein n=1 Tax=Paenibacillus odorifer TaxID=189426 RepID=A0A1R0YAC3_9BACL|nr:hypothetical protein [Paenibacillus odorifer]OMD44299.1 hypothetical protein BSK52_01860 [Paenibacillus odorifer]